MQPGSEAGDPDPQGEEAEAPEGSFKQVEPTTQSELDELDPNYREVD